MTLVLDIGPGIRPQLSYTNCITICVEPHYEYVLELLKKTNIVVLHTEWKAIFGIFPPLSVDYVTIYDVIEHLDKEEGKRLLQQTLPLARIGVSIFTPVGFVSQEPGEDGLDAWGYHGGDWQRHKSGWTPDEFPDWEIKLFETEYEVPSFAAYWKR